MNESFNDSFNDSFDDSFNPFPFLFIQFNPINPSIHSFIHSFFKFVHSFIQFIHSLIQFTHSFIHSLTHFISFHFISFHSTYINSTHFDHSRSRLFQRIANQRGGFGLSLSSDHSRLFLIPFTSFLRFSPAPREPPRTWPSPHAAKQPASAQWRC